MKSKLYNSPITTTAQAKEFFDALHKDGLLFHPEDSALDCLMDKADEATCKAINLRIKEAYKQRWGKFGCPCGYCLHITASERVYADVPKLIDFKSWTDMQLREAVRFADVSPQGKFLLAEIEDRKAKGIWLKDGSKERLEALIARTAPLREPKAVFTIQACFSGHGHKYMSGYDNASGEVHITDEKSLALGFATRAKAKSWLRAIRASAAKLDKTVASFWVIVGSEAKAKTERIEAHGIKGMQSKPWRKVFSSAEAMTKWVEDNGAEVLAYTTPEA